MHRAQQGLGSGLVPEPQAGESVLGGLGGFHLGRRHARSGDLGSVCGVQARRDVLPEHFHLARERHSGVLRSAPAQL